LEFAVPLGFLMAKKFSYDVYVNETSPLPAGALGTRNYGLIVGGLSFGIQATISKTF
jgi:hypothetical protein